MMAALAASTAMQHAAAQESSRPVKVAVIDSGVAPIRILRDIIEPNRDLAPTARTRLSSPHGTMVASIIAKRARKPIRIYPYRIDSECIGDWCEMPVSRLAAAVRDATSQGVDVIQISSYGTLTRAARQALDDATAAGIHVVLCAGNDGGISPYVDLADSNPLIHVVGALKGQGGRADFSSRGSKAMVWRLGTGLSANDDHGQVRIVQGTSFAASVYTAEIVNNGDWSRRSRTQASPAQATIAVVTQDVLPSIQKPLPIAAPSVDAIAAPPTPDVIRVRSRAVSPAESVRLHEPKGIPIPQPSATPVVKKVPPKMENRSRALPPSGS